MIRLLIDEQLSPRLVQWLAERGIFAQHVVHVGRAGMSDPDLWRQAFVADQIVVTTNARDFLTLAAGVELHPGLIVLRRSGLTRNEQWRQLVPVIDHLLVTGDDLVNQVIEVWDVDDFEQYPLPID